MIKRRLVDIQDMVSGTGLAAEYHNNWMKGVSTDSRKLVNHNIFIPLIGENFDGHAYVADVLAQGAAAAFWQKDKPNPPEHLPLSYVDDTLEALQKLAHEYRNQLNVRVIGITGSNGKTTTKDMVAGVLSTTYKTHKTEGNLNNHIGVPLTLLQLEEDTEMAVIEMGMSGRDEIALLSVIAEPEVAVITNIGESHLLQLGSRDEIAKAKLEIVKGLKEGGLLVYHGDEPLLDQYLEHAQAPDSMLTFRFGESEDNDIYPKSIMFHEEGTLFQTNSGIGTYTIPLMGQHNVINALAAIAVSKYMGVSEDDIVNGLKHIKMTGMRIEKVRGVTGLTILNDAYNASPTSMRAAIQLVQDLHGYHRKCLVLGDMLELGKDEETFHKQIGEFIQPERIDYIYTYGTLAEKIAEGAMSQFPADRVKSFQDKTEMVDSLAEVLSPRDVVLVKGSRGMKLEEVVEGLRDRKL